jgi:hypothetical protein
MKAHRHFFCLAVLCIGVLSLEGLAMSQQRRKRPSRAKPAATSTPSPAAATSSRNLTRPRAAELIKIHPSFKGTTDSDIPVGTFWFDWRDIKEFVKSNIQPLVDAGIVTFRETGRSNSVWFHECVVEITPEGESDQSPSLRGSERIIADIFSRQSPSKHPNYLHESTHKPTNRPPTTSGCGAMSSQRAAHSPRGTLARHLDLEERQLSGAVAASA